MLISFTIVIATSVTSHWSFESSRCPCQSACIRNSILSSMMVHTMTFVKFVAAVILDLLVPGHESYSNHRHYHHHLNPKP